MNIDLGSLVNSPLFGFLLAPVVKSAVDKLKRQVGTLDNSSAAVKQALAIGVSAAAVVLGHSAVTSQNVASVIQNLDPATALNIAIAGIGAIVSKTADHAAEAKDAAVAASIPSTSAAAEAIQ